MRYVDVLLPLPLEGLFTYAVPEEMEAQVRFGVRLVVPLGRSKTYVAIAVKTHGQQPAFKVKPVIQVLDDEPVLTESQFSLWQWIADYYMSPLGEVYNAAMPLGLKQRDGFKPKMETYITLTPAYRQEQALHIALNQLTRSPKQQKVFIDYLTMSHWDEAFSVENGERRMESEVSRDELMNYSHCTSSVLKSLFERKMLMTYEKEVGRLNHAGEPHLDQVKKLNEAQQEAYNQILFSFLSKNVTLLHGVTSSGKTEIYIHLIKQALERHEQVLYLLPEIALTVQIRERLQRFLAVVWVSITPSTAMPSAWRYGRNNSPRILTMSYWVPVLQFSCHSRNWVSSLSMRSTRPPLNSKTRPRAIMPEAWLS